MIDVCLLGTGGMMPLPNRFLTSLYVRTNGRALLVDCGEGTQTAIRAANLRFKPIQTLLLTHYHADHVSGLPGLLLTLGNEDRRMPLDMYGPPGLARVVNALSVIVPELPSGINCHEISGKAEFEASGLQVTAFEADHGMPCLSYAFNLPRPGKFDVEKARAAGVPLQLWGRLQNGESVQGFTPAQVLGAPRRGLRLVYSTDTRPLPEAITQGQEADLMILEGMFGGSEKDERALLTHHSTMNESARLAREAHAKRLWFTHFSPANPHPEEYAQEVEEVFPGAVISTDGQKLTLRFENE